MTATGSAPCSARTPSTATTPAESPSGGGRRSSPRGSRIRDVEGAYDAHYRVVAVDGEVAIATGTSTYFVEPGGPIDRVYDNCFVMRFGAVALSPLFDKVASARGSPPTGVFSARKEPVDQCPQLGWRCILTHRNRPPLALIADDHVVLEAIRSSPTDW